jgi:broad specificity phosphatase PhoE
VRIYLLRHGETEWNRLGRWQGRGDSPLTSLGVAQAKAYASLLARELGDPAAAALVTSPLGRARQTGAILRAAIPFAPDRCSESELLAEMSMGIWEGLTRAEVEARFPGALAQRDVDKWSYRIPQGESLALVQARAERWLRAQPPAEELVVVGHGMLSRVLRGTFLGLASAATLELPSHAHGQVYLLEGAGCRVLEVEVPSAPPTATG